MSTYNITPEKMIKLAKSTLGLPSGKLQHDKPSRYSDLFDIICNGLNFDEVRDEFIKEMKGLIEEDSNLDYFFLFGDGGWEQIIPIPEEEKPNRLIERQVILCILKPTKEEVKLLLFYINLAKKSDEKADLIIGYI